MALDRAFSVCYTLHVVVDWLCACGQGNEECPAMAQKESCYIRRFSAGQPRMYIKRFWRKGWRKVLKKESFLRNVEHYWISFKNAFQRLYRL